MNMFHHTLPRPPVVPGEETEGISQNTRSAGIGKLHSAAAPTPRTSSLHQHSARDGHAPCGFEPEGNSGSPRCFDSTSPPPCLRWARNLSSLLSDPDGVSLFRQYLASEGKNHSDALDFWFAIEGLRKQTDPDRVAQCIKVIYRRYFLKSQLGIPDSLRKAVSKKVKESTALHPDLFDPAQTQIEKLITETTYPNFLKSDLYLNHVQSAQNGFLGSGSGSSDPDSRSGPNTMLATLHEDEELITTNAQQPTFAPLTKDMLMYTQKRRAIDAIPKPEAFAGMYLLGKGGAKAYSSYNPVSRQDSELQSLSSDARTESDNMSLTDSSVDGTSLGGHHRMSRKQYQRHCRQVKESAVLNRDPYMHHSVIPRTQRLSTEQRAYPMKPDQFASILIEKLEYVKKNQEAQEKLAHKLLENEEGGGGPSAKSLADAIRERFMIDDDDVQDILDQHVSRVWSDLTPSRTPGVSSPRPKSPDGLRRSRNSTQPGNKVVTGGNSGVLPHGTVPNHHSVPHPYMTRMYPSRHPRKDKDVFSTFSSDSGNVHDFAEGSDHKLHLPKSKSMPDYESTDTYSSLPSHDGRFRGSRDWNGSNSRRYNKKPELTDSGVSVVSESVSIGSQGNKDKVLSWLIESDRSGCCSHADRDSERASSCSGSSRFDGKHHARPNPVRGRRSPPSGPAQPFVADPNMPPLPSPHTPTQLDEARRRLEDQARCKQTRQRCQTGKQDGPSSGASTLRKPKSDNFTTVVFSFCDEQYPYLSKIPGQSVTLKQFKEFLPKKGNYRYFFKTECEELDMRVIQEEITEDHVVLPLWEGKVMAQVKPVD